MSRLSPEALQIDGSKFKVGLVAARFNGVYVDGLIAGVKEALALAGVPEESIVMERVPGSNELPVAAAFLAETHDFDVIVALGVVIQGGTRHADVVTDSASYGLQKVATETGVPVIAGLVTGETEAQVEERCIGDIPKGKEFGQSALEMAQLRRKYRL